jgi:Outer membrane protein beta-barrel domain
MLKRFITVGVVAVSFFALQTAQAQVQVGVRGGANWGMVSKPTFLQNLSFIPNFQPSPGPTGAIFLEVPVSPYFSFRPEIGYIQKGFLVRESTDLNLGFMNLPIGARISYQSQELQVPLLAKINFTDGPVQPYMLIGPAVNYAIDGRVRTRSTGLFRSQPLDVNVSYGGALNRWDISGIAGLGLALNAGVGKFFVEGRYEYGFSRALQIPVIQVNARNRGFGASLGYSIPIGR